MAAAWLAASLPSARATAEDNRKSQEAVMKMPRPKAEGTISVEQAIGRRRTVRAFRSQALNPNQLSQLLWSAQGVTGSRGYKRAAPSAGALYPMDVYAVMGPESVIGVEAGVYRYEAVGHLLTLIAPQDRRGDVARACLSQMWMAKAPVSLVITAEYSRITGKYGQRGVRYAMIEAGHIGQNLFLQAEALGLKAGIVGAYHDERVIEVMDIPRAHEPLLIMPVGYEA